MALLDDLEHLSSQGSDVRTPPPSEAWRPRLELGSDGGFLVSTPRPATEQPDAAALLAEFDLDAAVWTVTSLRRSRWQRHDGEWLEAYRVSLAPAGAQSVADVDAERLVDEIRKWRPSKGVKQSTGELSFLANVGDQQIGKDAGTGSEGIVRRVLAGHEAAVHRFRELRKLGRNIGTIGLPQLGDCIEGSVSTGGKVMGRSDLGVTQQVRIGRRLLMAQIKAFAPLVERVVVPVVPGNHDEPQRFILTDPTDSWQVEIAAAVQDACAENPALAHVEFRYPERDNLTLAVDFGGTIVGFAHGHQARDAVKWWHGQATGRTPVGSADVLVTAHFHHYKVSQVGPRLWIQVPAMDGGSAWFRDKTGLESPTGIVTLVVGDGYDPRTDLAVVGGEQR